MLGRKNPHGHALHHYSHPLGVSTNRLPRPCQDPNIGESSRDAGGKCFRFLDLPKEIRLMVYEAMPFTHREDKVPFRRDKNHVILVTTTVPGLHIMGTCREIYKEASYILVPRLRKVLLEPPTIIIDAEELIGVQSLRDSIFVERNNVLDMITGILWDRKKSVDAIRRYRDNKLSTGQLRYVLSLGMTRIHKYDIQEWNAITYFILRAARYLRFFETSMVTMLKSPPITIIVAVPSSFQAPTVTITASRMRVLSCRLRGCHARLRTQTGPASLDWLLTRFARNTSDTARIWREVSFGVKLMYVEDVESNASVPQILTQAFQSAISNGIRAARNQGQGLLEFTGVIREEDRNSIA